MELDVPRTSSRIHSSCANLLSAGHALLEWRNVTISLLQSTHSWALQRAHSQARRDLHARLIRLETLAAPETIRRLDSNVLERCSEAYDCLSRQHSVSRSSFASALMGDERMRTLVGFVNTIHREDGSRDFLETIRKVLTQHDKGRALEYEEFKHVFIGISRALAAVSSPDGAALISSVSADVVKQLWATSVESTHRKAFGIVPASLRAGSVAPGCGFDAGSHADPDLRPSAALLADGAPRAHANLVQKVDDSQHGCRSKTTQVSASFLRTPGPRRLQHQLQHLASDPLPASLLTNGQGTCSKSTGLRQSRMVSLHPKPSITHARAGHRQRISARRVQVVAFSPQGPSTQRVHMAEVVSTSPPQLLELSVNEHAAVEEVVVPVNAAECSVATLKLRSEGQRMSAPACAKGVDPSSGSVQAVNSEPPPIKARAKQDAIPGGHDIAETLSIASMMSNDKGKGQSHPSTSGGSDRKEMEACGALFTTPKRLLLPWVFLVCFTLAAAVLAMVLIDNIKSSYEFLLWPWYNSFLQSLVYALSVQDLPHIILCSLRSRKHVPTTPAPSERSDDSMDDLEVDLEECIN